MKIMLIVKKSLVFLFFYSVMGSAVYATEPMKEDNKHIRTWNKFAMDTLQLHKKLTDGKRLEVKTRIGSYANIENFFKEEQYFEKGRLVSQIQWEKDNPDQLHTIEVYVHDSDGRVSRDYMAAYLPFYHNAPTQTLISFHHYNAQLHAFRTFDASGDKILERCEGLNHQGQRVTILLDEDDLYNDPDNVQSSADYKSCFAGLTQTKLGKYIIPQ